MSDENCIHYPNESRSLSDEKRYAKKNGMKELTALVDKPGPVVFGPFFNENVKRSS
jgi:hypothetical protein